MKKRVAYLILSVVGLLLIFGVLIKRQVSGTIGASIRSAAYLQELENNLTMVLREETGTLMFEGEEVPYYAYPGVHYLPINIDSEWFFKYKFSTVNEDVEIYWYEDPYWSQMETAIENSHPFTFLATDGYVGTKGNVIFTGLPMMTVCNLVEIDEEEEISFGDIQIFDPFTNASGQYEIINCHAIYEVRGNTSRRFPKKGFNLILCDENQNPVKENVLSMRVDEDWKLNAMYTDDTKIREIISIDLWNQIASTTETPYDAGTQMELLEVMMEGSYHGIYGIMTPIDYKQLSLDKAEDVLFKAKRNVYQGVQSVDDFTNVVEYYGQKIKPADRDITFELWRPIDEYLDMSGFKSEKFVSNPNRILKYIDEHMNMENLLNLELYTQAIFAEDNDYKNQYLAVDMKDDGDYTIWKCPWDMNYTFGDVYLYDHVDKIIHNAEAYGDIIETSYMFTEILLASGDKEFAKTLNEQWEILRKEILTSENLRQLVTEHYTNLLKSGAYARDEAQWPDGYHARDLEKIWNFFDRRLEFLDEYYASFLEVK